MGFLAVENNLEAPIKCISGRILQFSISLQTFYALCSRRGVKCRLRVNTVSVFSCLLVLGLNYDNNLFIFRGELGFVNSRRTVGT